MYKADSKGMAGMATALAIPNFVKSDILGPRRHTSKGLAIYMHAHSNLVEPCSLVSTGQHGLYYSIVDIRLWFDCRLK